MKLLLILSLFVCSIAIAKGGGGSGGGGGHGGSSGHSSSSSHGSSSSHASPSGHSVPSAPHVTPSPPPSTTPSKGFFAGWFSAPHTSVPSVECKPGDKNCKK